ncbi:MAG: four helix bundle protein [Deltaproteobacteria bacterium RIFCSPLOWO2_12_FULL_43_16]|nr:MAG: four helix bundle protein [Deltaproteobacteria bacterium GWA2_43_19]OGQ10998.1 MAG: four helix bundle protein [Deltaproteobacteria bacterium RIFCSPHIGHO2_02_FULL_43_33]OGQ37711.1 MAG: four helix bundle protein [Deltaproteobacteria bacterium RIFCSPLOWO2_01_FULL_42_9]OGQ60139.1 MAG: four helix bundle protein [Deltaproteobacteria bacterium RIFCSPLOWO2_12_FULL_43_16]HBR16197.1 four helix bundle protein [Deltaproteobacteria bacterium]
MSYNSFEDMPVWQMAMELAVKIFKLTETLPRKEDYGLTSQIRRAALSIPGNIAEGFGRKHTKDKLNFYYDSRASLAEAKSHLIYGQRVGYFNQVEYEDVEGLISCIWKEINMLITFMHKKTG